MSTEIKVVLTIAIVVAGVFLFDMLGETLGFGKYAITAIEVLALMYIWRWSGKRKVTKQKS